MGTDTGSSLWTGHDVGPDGVDPNDVNPDDVDPDDVDPDDVHAASHRGERRARPRGTDLLSDAADASHVPDEVLVRRARLGDRNAFAQLITRHGPSLYRYVYRLLHDTGDAEDCVQNVLFSAWRGLPSFRGESSLRTWLLVMGRREALKLLQRERPRFPRSGSRPPVDLPDVPGTPGGSEGSGSSEEVAANLPDERSDPARDAIGTELLHALDAALASLPERQRSAWILREVEDLSYTDIALEIGISPGAVRGLLQRARTTIAAALEAWR